MAAAADALTRASSGEARGESGTVRLTAGEMMGCELLPPMLAEFTRRYPRIHLELTLSNRNLDLLRRDADIAVRMVRPTQKALITRRVGVVPIGCSCIGDMSKSSVCREGPKRSLDIV